MTLPALASLDALRARITGGIPESDEPRAQAALDDASTLVRDEARKTWVTGEGEEATLDDDVPDTVVTICLAAARRAFTNPDSVSSESAGSYNVSYANDSLDVYLTRDEKRRARRAGGRTGLGAIPVTRGDNDTTTWVDVVGSDEPLPVDLPRAVT